jgi:hypothetical protein
VGWLCVERGFGCRGRFLPVLLTVGQWKTSRQKNLDRKKYTHLDRSPPTKDIFGRKSVTRRNISRGFGVEKRWPFLLPIFLPKSFVICKVL